MTAVEVLFVALGALAIGAAVLVALEANVVHCALWLILSMGALAGLYVLLAAEFVAIVQVLVYIGAVVVLLLFALMLTKAPIGALPGLDGPHRVRAGLVAAATGAVLVVTFAASFGGDRLTIRTGDVGTTHRIGTTLFSSWVLPFEILSVLLLAALIGAIVLSRHRPVGDGDAG